MEGYRKVEKLVSGGMFEKCKFSDLKKEDSFKLTDVDNDGSLSKDYVVDGSVVYVATSDAYLNEKGIYAVETN